MLDTACTSNVSGQNWLDNYIESLSEEEKASIKVQPSNKLKVFRFGGEYTKPSLGLYFIPACIAGKNVTIETETVDSDLPLLFSKTSIKKMGAEIRFHNDTA